MASKLTTYSREYGEAFPSLNNLFVTSAKQSFYAAPDALNILIQQKKLQKEMQKFADRSFKRNRLVAAFALPAEKNDLCHDISIIALSDKSFKRMTTKSSFDDGLFDFDHEVGHFVADLPYEQEWFRKEAYSDTFAALMHVKRNGMSDNFLMHHSISSAVNIIGSTSEYGATYYTAAPLCAVIDFSHHTDVSAMSLPEIVTAAREIVANYATPTSVLNEIKSAYDDAIMPDEVYRVMMRTTNNHDIYRAGKLFLMRDENKHVLSDNASEGWKEKQRLMAAFEKSSGFILNPAKASDERIFAETISKTNISKYATAEQIKYMKDKSSPSSRLAAKYSILSA